MNIFGISTRLWYLVRAIADVLLICLWIAILTTPAAIWYLTKYILVGGDVINEFSDFIVLPMEKNWFKI